MKTVVIAPGGGAAALVGFPMKSSKCKFILLRGMNLHGGLGGFWFFFFIVGLLLSVTVVFSVTLNIHQIIHKSVGIFKVLVFLKRLLLVAFK